MGNSNSVDSEEDNQESNCYLFLINMGNSVGGNRNSSGSSSSHKSSKRSVDKKVELASKTGILSLHGMSLKLNSSVWGKLMIDGTFVKIKTLDISENMLKTLPNEVIAMTNLKTLSVSRCNLQRLPNMQALDKITNLTLDNNDLEANAVGILPLSITKLNLSFNHFQTFPATVASLTQLVELDLCNNRLDTIVGIENLINLVVLLLDDNDLTEITNEFGFLVKLKKLSVKRNKIEQKSKSDSNNQSISPDLFTNTNLDDLNLEGNTKLTKNHVLNMTGVDTFMERRKRTKDKSLKGGALTDHSLFGLD